MSMTIVIATPLYPPEVGGPATYSRRLEEGFVSAGHTVVLVAFAGVRQYPKLIRHVVYFWRVFRAVKNADLVFAFDTWSTGIPAVLAAKLRGKKSIVRIGGDFLWETYVERTHELIRLSEFYTTNMSLSLKERLIQRGTRWILRQIDVIVFNTAWQKHMWEKAYGFDPKKASVVENGFPAEREHLPARGRVFVAAGRPHALKNLQTLETAFAAVKQAHPDVELDTRILPPREHEMRIRDAYAVVIPSVSEVNSNTAIDAIRYGKPFIMTSDTGARERLSDAGIFVDTLDASVLHQAMERLLDAGEYERASKRVQAFAFSHSWEEVVKEFLVLLNKLCAS